MAQRHGKRRHPVYTVWKNMKHRCTSPQYYRYADYGGRGIDICPRWMCFSLFWEDMGDSWFEGASIERIDNNKGYHPENCRWATVAEQARNKRNSLLVSIDGTTMCLKDWCKHYGISYNTVYDRIKKRGVDPLEALNVSVQKNLTE